MNQPTRTIRILRMNTGLFKYANYNYNKPFKNKYKPIPAAALTTRKIKN